MNSEDPALPDAPNDPEDALRMSAFTILSRLQSGTEDVVRLDVALAAVAMERERCARLCEWLPIGTGLHGKTFAEAIRGEGTGGKMAQGFEA